MKRRLKSNTTEVGFVLKEVRRLIACTTQGNRLRMLNALLRSYSACDASEALMLANRVNEIMGLMDFSYVPSWSFVADAKVYPSTATGWSSWRLDFKGADLTSESLRNIFRANGANSPYFLATSTQPVICMPVSLNGQQEPGVMVAMMAAMHEMGILQKTVRAWLAKVTKGLMYGNQATRRVDYIIAVMEQAKGLDKDVFKAMTEPDRVYSSDMVECFLSGHLYKRTRDGMRRLALDMLDAGGDVLADTLASGLFVDAARGACQTELVEWMHGMRVVTLEGRNYFQLACDVELCLKTAGKWDSAKDLEGAKELSFEAIFTELKEK